MVRVGIIGGSGLDNPELLQDFKEIEVDTNYGKPSDKLIIGKLGNAEVIILPRHGKGHKISPTGVNYRANIQALKDQKVDCILATTACGSLREDIGRGDFVILDQFIDFTRHRDVTFFDTFDFKPIHTSMSKPFSDDLRNRLIDSCIDLGFPNHEKGTVITIEGNRFSTIAESNMFRSWGADVINMSIAPEAILANEAEIEYATIAMSTDYDCWKQDENPVTWSEIKKVFESNAERVKQVLIKTIESFSREEQFAKSVEIIKNSIRTIPNFPKQGIMFRDITTLLKDKEGLQKLVEMLYDRYKNFQIDAVAGIESRGFILAGMLASKLGTGLVLIRKPGKLPAETISETYELEYGIDRVEIHKDAINQGQKVLLVDDLIATGGTALATCNLIKKLGGEIVECCFVIDLPDLGGKKKLEDSGYKVFDLVEFEGE